MPSWQLQRHSHGNKKCAEPKLSASGDNLLHGWDCRRSSRILQATPRRRPIPSKSVGKSLRAEGLDSCRCAGQSFEGRSQNLRNRKHHHLVSGWQCASTLSEQGSAYAGKLHALLCPDPLIVYMMRWSRRSCRPTSDSVVSNAQSPNTICLLLSTGLFAACQTSCETHTTGAHAAFRAVVLSQTDSREPSSRSRLVKQSKAQGHEDKSVCKLKRSETASSFENSRSQHPPSQLPVGLCVALMLS